MNYFRYVMISAKQSQLSIIIKNLFKSHFRKTEYTKMRWAEHLWSHEKFVPSFSHQIDRYTPYIILRLLRRSSMCVLCVQCAPDFAVRFKTRWKIDNDKIKPAHFTVPSIVIIRCVSFARIYFWYCHDHRVHTTHIECTHREIESIAHGIQLVWFHAWIEIASA